MYVKKVLQPLNVFPTAAVCANLEFHTDFTLDKSSFQEWPPSEEDELPVIIFERPQAVGRKGPEKI